MVLFASRAAHTSCAARAIRADCGADYPFRSDFTEGFCHCIGNIILYQRYHIATLTSTRELGPHRASQTGCFHQIIQF